MRRATFPLLILLATLLGTALLAGCVEEDASVKVTPYLRVLEAAPGRSVPLAVHVRSVDAFKQDVDVRVEGLPAGWSASASEPRLALAGRSSTAVVVNVTIPPDAQLGAHDVRVRVGPGAATITLDVRDAGATPARPGSGVHLEHVVWAANGSLVTSNAPALRNQSAIPLAQANATALGLPEATNATLVGHLPGNSSGVPEGRVALPSTWEEALLGKVAGDVVWVRMEDAPAELAPVGALLRVLEVVAPPAGPADP